MFWQKRSVSEIYIGFLMLAWNVINLLDGEAGWFLAFLAILSFASILSHGWRWLSQKLTSDYTPIKNGWVQASILPVSCLIWFVAVVSILDLLSDRLLSESFSTGLKPFFCIAVVLLVGWFLLRANHNMRHILLEQSRRHEIALDPGKVFGLTKLASVVIVVLVAILLMDILGVGLNTLIAFGGISGLALAFAAQEVIANFFGGIMIHVNHPFSVGDTISLPNSGIDGIVEDIGWYETILRSKDGQPIYIPNALFSKAYVINGTRRSHRQASEKISIRHEDIGEAINVVEDIRSYLQNHPSVAEPHKVLVYIDQIGPASVDVMFSCTSDCIEEAKFLKFRDEVFVQAVNLLQKRGCELAVPIEKIVKI